MSTGERSGFEHMFGHGVGRNALHSFTVKIPRKTPFKYYEIPQSTLSQHIIPQNFSDGETHNSYIKNCFNKFNFTKLFVYNHAKTQNPAKIQNLPKIAKNSLFFVVFARKINVFSYFCAVFVHSEKSPREENCAKNSNKDIRIYI